MHLFFVRGIALNKFSYTKKYILEMVSVELILPGKTNIFGSCIYRSPSSNSLLFYEELKMSLSKFCNKDVYIIGDYKINPRR